MGGLTAHFYFNTMGEENIKIPAIESLIDPLAHTLEVLEFGKIIQRIETFCESETAKRRVRGIKPLSDPEAIKAQQELISEVRNLLNTSGQPDLTGLGDPQDFIVKATKEGVLTEEELWEISKLSRLTHRVMKLARDRDRYPRLRSMLDGLSETTAVHRNIDRFIAPPGVFVEEASERLTQLKAERKVVHDKLQVKLQSMLEDEKYADFWQEQLITLRNERFVLPLKAEHKSHLPGVIHDRSATGATLFVEPLEVVPLNNQLREIELEAKQERTRILRTLSEIVAAYAEKLLNNLKILHELDFAVAIAKFADTIDANMPTVIPDGPVKIVEARHPLLHLELGKDNVVPLDIELSPKTRCVIITGPNMGGKTVALKTIGLVILMGMCGLPVPAQSKTIIPVFTKFFADIGDEQSIESSISSFASHILHYKQAAEEADENSLVLFDELGSATDPQESLPLAWALLEHLIEKGATTIVNTHIGGLLGLAAKRDDVVNAAMEFDEDKMKPTYRLLVGVPGRSWAAQIAQMLGFPEKILTRAKELTSGGDALSDVLTQLRRKIREVEDIKRRLSEELADAKAKRQILEGLIISNREKEKELSRLRRVYEDLRDSRIAAAVEREIDRIREEWEKIIAEKPQLYKKQKQANEFISRLKARLKRAEKAVAQRMGMPKKLEPGQRVFIYRLRKWGDVTEGTDEQGFVKILVGRMTLRIHSSGVDTETEYERKRAQRKKEGGINYEPRVVPKKIDVRGLSPEEAWDKVDRLLDDAVASDVEQVLIVHGKGKGVLRRAIRDKLHGDPRVAQLRLPDERMGGDGATIVVMRKEEEESSEQSQENADEEGS